MEVLHTVSKKKKITLLVLLGLLVWLGIMSAGALEGQKDYFFLFIGLIHLVYAADYIRSYIMAWEDVAFFDARMELIKNKKRVSIDYARIVRFEEKRNNYIEIVLDEGGPYLIHGEFKPSMDLYDEMRTVNIIRGEIRQRSGKEIEAGYKRR